MRWIATFFTLLALAATGLAANELHVALTKRTPHVAAAFVDQGDAAPIEVALNTSARSWPTLFGEIQPPKVIRAEPPTPEPVVDQQPPAPPRPSLASLGYELKGVVRAGDAVWGLVSHPTGQQILRQGDTLTQDITIARIDETGLWVHNGGDDPELLGFTDE